MPGYLATLLLLLCLALPLKRSNAQVYEYTPLAVDCSGTWEDGNCWNKTLLDVPANCTENGDWPPFAPSGCEVHVIINHNLAIDGDVELGGTLTSLQLGADAELTIDGNLTIEGQEIIDFLLEGNSEMRVSEALIISQGGTNDPTVLNLGGDGSGMLTVATIVIENRAVLNVLEGGAITSEGPTEYSGNSSVINAAGFFRTESLLVTGGRLHQFNTFGNSQVYIDNDIDIRGDTKISIGGTSEVYVGRDVLVDGSATIIADDNSKIYVCGEFPTPTEGGKAQEIDEGKFFPCSVLPVSLLDQQVEYYAAQRKAKLSWSTASEEDFRHFIIERAVGSPDFFNSLDRIPGEGGTTEIRKYEFWDEQLPLFETRIYYRLLQVGQSGDTEFIGEVLALDIPGTGKENLTWRIYPNPNRGGEGRISILNQEKYSGEPIEMILFGPFGEVVSFKNRNLESLNLELSASFNSLAPGLYFIHLRWGSESQILKVLKK
ncbi:T9SS type A sorting domain-containing protein [Cyclobacterium plantarum]|uniref:T9SS type A sorting domain-containing protein n=1 Tax=Cyclobacterium plantarum TaxID=2716263 RepID=A0ABX0H4H2_9BACT|nr:T9SS type A sorting domain-containing protein [Cyclobacterium plantarum]NHE55204.1 T9SS type A sorting domain-containing protein [Cyclobacterium plantarum]